MKKLFTVMAVLAPVALFAQSAELPISDFIGMVFQALGGLKGASVMGIVVIVIQLLMKFMETSLAGVLGKYKLLIVAVLSLAGSLIGQMATGISFVTAIMSSVVLTALQVLGHQIYVQFIKKES